MVAVISGNGLGFFGTQTGASGSTRIGQGTGTDAVNIATGNLLLQGQDETLVFNGLTIPLLRTYNSSAVVANAGADGWLTGFERRVALTGTLNNSASTVLRYTGDGGVQTFKWSATNTYVSVDGDGAQDTLSWDATNKFWTWTEGSTRDQETYADHAAGGQLTAIKDTRSGAFWSLTYSGGRLASISYGAAANAGIADAILYGYDANGQLTSISTRESGVARQKVQYLYEATATANGWKRLLSVIVDLTPADPPGDIDTWQTTASANNGYLHRTDFTYADSTTARISTVRTSDGGIASYTYDASGRVASVTRGDTNTNDADGAGETVTLTYDTANRKTTITDSTGRSWLYTYDTLGRLIEVADAAVDGIRTLTNYAYNVNDKDAITQRKTTRGGVVVSQSDYGYDTSGNLTWQWESANPGANAAARAISRTYVAGTNQLATETVYTTFDSDGAGATVPTGGLVTRFFYDAQNRLRFRVDPQNGVVEYAYVASGNGVGELASTRRYLVAYDGTTAIASATTTTLANWATASKKASSTLSEATYDAAGRLSQTIDYASVNASTGAGVNDDTAAITTYAFDAQGRLLARATLRSSTVTANDGRDLRDITTYAYDGLGRVLSEQVGQDKYNTATSTWVAQSLSRRTTYAYTDASGRIQITRQGGSAGEGANATTADDLLTLQVYNGAGRLISTSESAVSGGGSTRTQQFVYDSAGRLRMAQDAGGARTYSFYDGTGELAGVVDATGALVEFVRDGLRRITSTKAYAIRLDTSAWMNAGKVVPQTVDAVRPTSDPNVRIATTSYDGDGRVLKQVDAEGGITLYTYDELGRLAQTQQTDASSNQTTARTVRSFYDTTNNLIATLDAEGYLVEYAYDPVGRRIRTTAYATATPPGSRATGTLAALRPGATAKDQVTRTFYDGRGNVIGELDAENYVTEYVYDASRNQRAVKRYGASLAGLNGSETFATLRSGAQAGGVRVIGQRTFDVEGRLLLEQDAEGTVTRSTYDYRGQLIKVETGLDSTATVTGDTRTGFRRFDVFGNLIGEVSGEGATRVTAGMTDAQLASVIAQYGVTHSVDLLGQRIESVDGLGNKTWYFYDAAGRMTFTVRGVADAAKVPNAQGEVTETRYDAFGAVTDTLAYTGRITLATPGNRTSVANAISTLTYAAATDSRVQLQYDRLGQVRRRLSPKGETIDYAYNAFGDLIQQTTQIDAARSTITRLDYDRRGARLTQTDDVGTGLLNRIRSWTYDAFGRLTGAVDATGITTSLDYDRLGRQVAQSRTVSGRLEKTQTTYDAWSRVARQINAANQATTFAYDDTLRRVVVTSAEGVSLVTARNRQGETETVIDAAGRQWKTTYDKDGRVLTQTASDGGVQRYEYDPKTGLLKYRWDETDRKTEYQYDAVGRLVAQIVDPDTGGLKLTTQYAYDGQGRQVRVTDATGVVTELTFDVNGQLTKSVRDLNGLNGQRALRLTTTYTWDARGLRLSVVDGAGGANPLRTDYTYDALGRRTKETVDPAGLKLETSYVFDAEDRVVSRTDATGRVTRYTYDAAGRAVHVIDGAGGVTRTWYDVAGRVVAVRQYAKAINPAALTPPVTVAAVDALLQPSDLTDVQAYRIYDKDGRVRFAIDGAGAVTVFAFDAASRAVRTVRYANAVTLDATLRAALQAGTATSIAVTPDATRDDDTFVVLDAAGRARYAIAADGAVVETVYDKAGRAIETRAYPNRLALSAQDRTDLGSGVMTEASIASKLTTAGGTPRAQLQVFDAAGRALYTLTRIEAGVYTVAEIAYDAAGRVVGQTAYGITLPAATAPTEAGVRAAITAALSTDATLRATQIRTTRQMFDAAGRLRFAVDASGAVTQTIYDAADRVLQTIAYGVRPSVAQAGSPPTVALLTIWAQAQPAAAVRTTTSTYDAAGRLKTRIDALTKSELYDYDGAGRLIQYTDRNGSVWNYGYDGAGRRTTETGPAVDVATVDKNGVVTVTNRRIVTRMRYDGQGNVLTRTEDDGTASARAVNYEYDNRGHQVRTIFPDAGRIDEATGELVASGQTPTIEVTYDALGRAVVQKDVRGFYSYKVYTVAGRLAYDIDAGGYATGYDYDAFGGQITLRRFATALNTAAIPGWSTGKPLTASQVGAAGVLPLSSDDRLLSTAYDARGQATSVVQAAVTYYDAAGTARTANPTTQFTYDAYGQLTSQAVLLDATASRWATTYRFYDVLGRNVVTVDAEGYVTTNAFNATGEVIEVIEYARALAAADRTRGVVPAAGDAISGYDRSTRTAYDALGRKASESTSRHFQRSDGSQGARDLTVNLVYDNEGRVTSMTNDAGTTETRYDALGRVLSVKEPSRAVLAGTSDSILGASTGNDLGGTAIYEQRSPYTTTRYDGFGNAVEIRRYATGAGANGTPAQNAADQVQLIRYDVQGRAVMTRDSLGNAVYSQYDAADHLLRRWYRLDGSDASYTATVDATYAYDNTGRQTRNLQGRVGAATKEYDETVVYNAFGEIQSKSYGGLSGGLVYEYDRAGRQVSSNETGATRRFGYDLAGQQVLEIRKAYLAAGTIVDVTTLNTLDRLGRIVQVKAPTYGDSGATPVVQKRLDRWGNVLQVIDARGYQTDYRYNEYNQITREERPLVEVVSEQGTRSWARPVNQWFYDAMGRLIGTQDANGNLRRNEYDNVGQLTVSRNAYGQATLYAYDVQGNQRYTQNALGYITYKEYDSEARVVAIGDFLPNATGSGRDKFALQSYALNQNGQRLRVTDALNHSAFYDYDGRNQLLRSRTSMGVTVTYAYDVGGRKILERNARVSGGGSLVDRDNETVQLDDLSWDYDAFGRLVDHNNLSGRDFDYAYEMQSGQQTGETAQGGAAIPDAGKTFSYFANGSIRKIVEVGGNIYAYEYDAAGNRTLEDVTTTDGLGNAVRTVTRSVYDSNNRLQRAIQDNSGVRVFDLTYEYDAVGNRRHVTATSAYGPNAVPITTPNVAPVVVAKPIDQYIRFATASQFTLLASDIFRDADGDALAIDVTGDGGALPSWLTVTQGDGGVIAFNANPAAADNGRDIVVRLTARESATASRLTATTTFVLRVGANHAPEVVTAGTAQIRVKTGTPWSREIVATDWFRDIDLGDHLTLSLDAPAPNPLPWATAETVPGGVLRLSGTPVAGTYTVAIRATDDAGATAVKTFVFTVAANSTPTGTAPALQEMTIGRDFAWKVPLSSVFADVDGDTLEVTAAGLPSWLSFQYLLNQATPELLISGYVPATLSPGDFPIGLTARDPDGASKTVTFNLRALFNRGPARVQPSITLNPAHVAGDFEQFIDIATLFRDPENDQFTLRADNMPAWMQMTVDEAAGRVRFFGTPLTNAYAGTPTFQLVATDKDGQATSTNVSINVAYENAPVRNTPVPLVDRTLYFGRSFSFQLPAGLFTDADGDPIQLNAFIPRIVTVNDPDPNPGEVPAVMPGGGEVQSRQTDPSTQGNASTQSTHDELYRDALPSWLVFDPNTRTFSGTVPANASPGTFVIRIEGFDGYWANNESASTVVGGAGNNADTDFVVNLATYVNSAPIINEALPNRTVVHGGSVNFPLPANAFVEPDGDGMTYSAQVLVGSTWQSLSSIGLAINATTGLITGTASNLTQTQFKCRIIATDTFTKSSAPSEFFFNVTNTPPTVTPIPDQSVGRNTDWSFDIRQFFNDVNGNATLSFTQAGLPAGLSMTNGVISGRPTAPYDTYTVTIAASDGSASVPSTFKITVSNAVPVGPAIGPQTATAGSPWSFVVPAFTDPNGDAIDYRVGGMPAWMSFNKTTRTLSGTPGPVGAWTLTVYANDGKADGTQSFTVTTPNSIPVVVTPIPAQSAGRNMDWSFTVPANTFRDDNGDTLKYTATGMPAGITFDQATRTFSGRATTLTSATVTVTADDQRGGLKSTTFVLSVANYAPGYTANSLPARGGTKGQSVSWALPAGSFSDPNQDALSYSLFVLVPDHWVAYGDPADPSYRIEPAAWMNASAVGLGIDANGTISGTIYPLVMSGSDPSYPYYTQSRTDYGYTLKIVAKDPSGAAAEGTFITQVNAAPTSMGLPNQWVKSGMSYSFTVPAFYDDNGDTLTYFASGYPAGVSWDATNRVLSGVPTVAGAYNIVITADDGHGGITNDSYTLTVQANTAPTPVSIPNLSGTVGAAFGYQVGDFNDADYDTLTYSATGLPPGLAINASTRAITGTPSTAGTYTVTVYADDRRGGVASSVFTITIANVPPPNVAPVINRYPGNPAYSYFGTNRSLVDPQTMVLPLDTFIDGNNDPLTYTILSKPDWLSYTLTAAGHEFTGVPNHESQRYMTSGISIRASDGRGGSVVLDFYVTSEFDYYDPRNPTDPQVVSPSPMAMSSVAGSASNASSDMHTPVTKTDASTQGVVGPPPPQSPPERAMNTQDFWYAYDKENRLTVNRGRLVNGEIVVSNTDLESYALSYDAVGRAVSRTYLQAGSAELYYVYRTAYDLRGNKSIDFHLDRPGSFSNGISKTYLYNAAGQLTETRSYYSNGSKIALPYDPDYQFAPMLDVSGWIYTGEQFEYDDDGRMKSQTSYARAADTNWQQYYPGGNEGDQYSIDALEAQSRTVNQLADGRSGYDAAGRLTGYQYTDVKSFIHNYTSTFVGWESYQESYVNGTSGNPNYKTTSNTLTYDAYGRLTNQREHTNNANVDDRMRGYAYDGDGKVQLRRSGVMRGGVFTQDAGPGGVRDNVLFVNAAGQQQAELTEAGRIGTYDMPQLQGLGAQGNYAAGGGKVVVLAGEKLSDVARRVYGTTQLWYVLADANGLGSADQVLIEGTQLNAPSATVSSNDAGTFKPYNPGEAIGSTAPGLPYITPPPKQQCNKLAMIIMIVVIIVVTVYTAGAAASAAGATTSAAGAGTATAGATAAGAGAAGAGTAAAGAGAAAATTSTWATGLSALSGGLGAQGLGAAFVGGVVGSVAGQAVGSAMGITSFSWRNALVSGATTMATAGFGTWVQGAGAAAQTLNSTQWARAAASAVVGGVTSYAANRAVGNDVAFSWRGIAASAVSAAVSTGLGQAMGLNPSTNPFGGSGEFWKDVGNGLLSGAVSLHTQRAFGFNTRIDYGAIAADAFGNALANAAIRDFRTAAAVKGLGPTARDAYQEIVTSGYSPEQARGILDNTSLKEALASRDARNAWAKANYDVENFDQLTIGQQQRGLAATSPDTPFALNRAAIRAEYPDPDRGVFEQGIVIDIFGGRVEEPSLYSFGVAASSVISQAQVGLGRAVHALGEDNVRGALIATQFALGGIPKTIFSLAVSNSPAGEWLAEKAETYLKQPLSNAYASGLFGARNDGEVGAVRPASNLTADFTIGLMGAVTGIAAYKGTNMILNAARNARVSVSAATNRLETVVRNKYASSYAAQIAADTLGNRGLTFVGENLGKPRNAAMQAARDFESGTTGAFSDIATRQRQVPALRFENPKPQGAPYVKFDGYQQLDNGIVELIDSKTRIVPFATKDGPFISASVRDGLVRKSQALAQNPGYTGVIELPTAAARREAQQVLRQLGITNISTRVRVP